MPSLCGFSWVRDAPQADRMTEENHLTSPYTGLDAVHVLRPGGGSR